MPCTARVCMPHTIALVCRLKRVALFPGGQRHSECTQNTHLRKTQRGSLPESLYYMSSLVVLQGSKRNVKILNSEKLALVFLEGGSREHDNCLLRPAWLENSPTVTRKGILKQNRAHSRRCLSFLTGHAKCPGTLQIPTVLLWSAHSTK